MKQNTRKNELKSTDGPHDAQEINFENTGAGLPHNSKKVGLGPNTKR